AVGRGDRVVRAGAFVLDRATARPAAKRFSARRRSKLLGKGGQLGGVHARADGDRRRAGQARPKPSSTLARIRCPTGVRTDSGWNCTPTCLASASLIAIAIPSITACTRKRGGGLGVQSE